VQSTYYCPETMSSAQQPSLQHWKNRCPIGANVGAMTSARNYQVQRLREDPVPPEEPTPKHRFNRWSQKVAAAVSEKPTATSEHSVTGRTDALAPEVPMPTQKSAQLLQTASSSLRPIYMCSPSHLKLSGVPRSLIHIQEHLQAIQVQIDQILKLSTSFVSVCARISSLKSVRARCCTLWLVLE